MRALILLLLPFFFAACMSTGAHNTEQTFDPDGKWRVWRSKSLTVNGDSLASSQAIADFDSLVLDPAVPYGNEDREQLAIFFLAGVALALEDVLRLSGQRYPHNLRGLWDQVPGHLIADTEIDAVPFLTGAITFFPDFQIRFDNHGLNKAQRARKETKRKLLILGQMLEGMQGKSSWQEQAYHDLRREQQEERDRIEARDKNLHRLMIADRSSFPHAVCTKLGAIVILAALQGVDLPRLSIWRHALATIRDQGFDAPNEFVDQLFDQITNVAAYTVAL